MSSSTMQPPQAMESYSATGNDPDQLRGQLFKQAQGKELYYQEVANEDGTITVHGYPRTDVMDLIYAMAFPAIKIVDDRAAVKVKSNRLVTDFFIIIQSRRSASFIGKRGQTLDAIEGLVGFMVSKQFPGRVTLSVDIDNYRRRRQTQLEMMLKRVVQDIESDHKERPIPELGSKERKFIHQFFSGHPYLTTESRGEGRERTLFILPRTDIREA
jgi:predicted RNA-binding protein Jag